MTFDENKLSYLSLFLDEPIYVIKADDYMVAPVLPPEKPAPIIIEKPQPAILPVQNKPEIPKPVEIKNKNKVLILFNNEQSPYLNKVEEALLKKILTAIKLDIDDVDMVNYNNIQRVAYVDFLKDKMLNQLISFGVSLTVLNLQIYLKKYEVERVEGIDMLLSDSLTELESSADKKKLLWKALQHMFMKMR